MRTTARKVLFGSASSRLGSRRFLIFAFAAASLIVAASGCGGDGKSSLIGSADDLDVPGVKIGGQIATVSLRTGEARFKKAKVGSYPNPVDAYAALEAGKIDAVIYDRPPMEYAATRNEKFVVLDDALGEGHIAVGGPFRNRELMERVNSFIKEYREDGTYQEMYDRWVKSKEPVMPDIPKAENPTGTLVIGFDSQNEPMSFLDSNGDPQGFDAEFIKRLCLYLNMDYKLETMYYDALFAAIEADKLDLAIANLDKTPEREETMLFSDDYLDCPCGIMILKSRYKEPERKPIASAADLEAPGTRIGGQIATVSLRTGEERFPNAEVGNYPNPVDAYAALEAGKIDAVIYDRPPMEYAATRNEKFVVLHDALGEGHIAVGGPFRNRELMERVNAFVKQYREDGTYKEMYDRWVKSKEPVMPDIPKAANPTGTLIIGFDSQNEPMSFLDSNGDPQGFDAEFIKRLCLYLNMDYKLETMYYDALFAAIEADKLDLAIANLDKTPEREETMLFSDDYLDCPCGIMILKSRWADAPKAAAGEVAPENLPFCVKMRRSFERTFIREDRWKMIVRGLWTTIVITMVSAFIGTLLAFVQCCCRRSRRAYLRVPAKAYIAVMQGTPILVILLIMYYIVFAGVNLSAWLVASIAFAMNFAAYAGEMMRTGVDGVDKGLIEAAKALGFGRFAVLRKIVFPLATRRILPVYKGEFISLLKTTSIVGYVAIQDLTKMSDLIRARTYEAFFPLVATAIVYFLTAHLLASGLVYLEYRLNPLNRRRAAKGTVNS